jgi:hypothetical protein
MVKKKEETERVLSTNEQYGQSLGAPIGGQTMRDVEVGDLVLSVSTSEEDPMGDHCQFKDLDQPNDPFTRRYE